MFRRDTCQEYQLSCLDRSDHEGSDQVLHRVLQLRSGAAPALLQERSRAAGPGEDGEPGEEGGASLCEGAGGSGRWGRPGLQHHPGAQRQPSLRQ